MSIGGGVIAAVTFQQVGSTPHAETGTQSHNQSLKNFDSRVKEFHSRFSFMETFFGRLKNEMFYGFEKDYPSFQAFSKAIASILTITITAESKRKQNGCLPSIASQEISATFKQHICDMQYNVVAVALKS